MKKINLTNRTCMLIGIVAFNLLITSCLNLRSCSKDILGRYYCNNISNATNYIDLNGDGSFTHYYKDKNIELSHNGTWKKSDDGYCTIELNEWKNFNEKGKDYKEFGNGILFINGDYLDISPDGESSTSFKKEQK